MLFFFFLTNIWSQTFLPQGVFLNYYALLGTPSLLDPPPLIVSIKGGVGWAG